MLVFLSAPVVLCLEELKLILDPVTGIRGCEFQLLRWSLPGEKHRRRQGKKLVERARSWNMGMVKKQNKTENVIKTKTWYQAVCIGRQFNKYNIILLPSKFSNRGGRIHKTWSIQGYKLHISWEVETCIPLILIISENPCICTLLFHISTSYFHTQTHSI